MNPEDKNHLAVKETLDSLERLGPTIEEIVAPAMQAEPKMKEMTQILQGRALSDLDSHAYLRLLTEVPTVRENLNELALCHVCEMIAMRNLLADGDKFRDSDVARAQDTAERLQDYLEHYFEEAPVREDLDEADRLAPSQDEPSQDESPQDEPSLDSPPPGYSESETDDREAPFHQSRFTGSARDDYEPRRPRQEGMQVPDHFEPEQVLKGEIVGVTNHGLMLNMNVSRAYLAHKKNLGGIHIRDRSELSEIYELGETIEVKVLSIDELGRPNLAPVSPRVPQDSGESMHQRPRHSGYQDGDRQDGHRQGGYRQGGDRQDGYRQGGYRQGGDRQGGYRQGGDRQGGYRQGGDRQGGYRQGGDRQGGYRQGGDRQGGYRQGGDRQANGNGHRHHPDPDTPMPKTGEIVRGTIRGVYPRGASISLDSGWSGYLHISNISHEFVKNVGDYVAVGQGLELIVLDVDAARRRIDLGLKQRQKSSTEFRQVRG